MNKIQGLIGGAQAPMTQCGCIGPQRGEPLCPCQMRYVIVENGRYVQRRDLGPAPTPADKQGFEPFGYTERS